MKAANVDDVAELSCAAAAVVVVIVAICNGG